jgi:hypothetical protein
MAPGSVVARVVRVSDDAADDGARSEPPTTPRGLRALAAAPLLDNAARLLATDEVHVVGYASTTSAYVIGVEDETALVSRLAAQLEVPVAATCASAVLALRALGVERVALVGAPWFEPQLNELGGAYFRSQGFDVVSSASADLPHDRRRIEPASVFAWTSRHVPDDAGGVFIGGNGFRAARDRTVGDCPRSPRAHLEPGASLEPPRPRRRARRDQRLRPVVCAHLARLRAAESAIELELIRPSPGMRRCGVGLAGENQTVDALTSQPRHTTAETKQSRLTLCDPSCLRRSLDRARRCRRR